MWEIPSPQNKKGRAENNNGRQAQPSGKGVGYVLKAVL
jgi:hypothetical protein